jgi:hypothetical protein
MNSPERISEPQAVAELLAEVLRVWRTRDGKRLTDAEIRERAANGAMALTSAFSVRHRDARRWAGVFPAGKVADPRVSHQSSEYGKRHVPLTLLLDDDGQLWEMVGRDNPTFLGGPPLTEAIATPAGDES